MSNHTVDYVPDDNMSNENMNNNCVINLDESTIKDRSFSYCINGEFYYCPDRE